MAFIQKTFSAVLTGLIIAAAQPVFAGGEAAGTGGFFMEPLKSSPAYQQYQRRPKSELSKLLFLMDRFKGSPAEVVYDGSHYDSSFALKNAKAYIAKNYKKNQRAELWVREHAYRSDPGRQLILFKYPDGNTRPLRDVLLEELAGLEKA